MVIESVKQAVKRLPPGSMRILMENTAGMGTRLGRGWKRWERLLRG